MVGRYMKTPDSSSLRLFTSGCTRLDLVLGGGWPLGRMSNIIGDKSTGKSLLAIEAAANFAQCFPTGDIWYREVEAAFDQPYAAGLGMPVERIDFGVKKFDTIEDIFEDLHEKIAEAKKSKQVGLYMVDSLDALSDRAEMARAIDEGSYNLTKQKKLGELFRKLIRDLESTSIALIIISQVRDKIGITFGRQTTRSGGKAMDFYASLIVYLSHVATLTRTIKGEVRATGIRVRAKCDKNKISLPFRECDFVIRFGYGIDNLQSNLEWLESCGQLAQFEIPKGSIQKVLKTWDKASEEDYLEFNKSVDDAVRKHWFKIEEDFKPSRQKYKGMIE